MNQAVKDFVRGMGQALDLGATSVARRHVERKTETQAVAEHWNRVGNYVRGACEQVVKETHRESSSKF